MTAFVFRPETGQRPREIHMKTFFFLEKARILAKNLRFVCAKTFFGEHLRVVSLVLGLELSCPWPRWGRSLALASNFFLCFWPRALCPRLHL